MHTIPNDVATNVYTPASLATAMASALARALPTVPAADAVEALWELLAAADAVATQEALL
jgi:hypothetical protein